MSRFLSEKPTPVLENLSWLNVLPEAEHGEQYNLSTGEGKTRRAQGRWGRQSLAEGSSAGLARQRGGVRWRA